MIGRREALKLLGGTLLAAPCRLHAQPRRNPRIGVLLYSSPRVDNIAPLLEGLQSHGYVDGKTATIDYRFAEGKPDRLPQAAAELVALKPDVIFAFGGDVAPHAKNATSSIPIIVMVSNDPVQSGLVKDLSHPGGNITGLTMIYDELAGKVLELLKEALPSMSRCAVLWNPDHADPEYRQTQKTASALGVRLQSLEVRRPADFDPAFKAAADAHPDGLVVVSSRVLFQQRKQIAEFAQTSRIPLAGGWGDWTKDGFLLTYGPSPADMMRKIPLYLDKILKGARPGDLPVERPTKFELVVNMKTARTLGIKIPQSVLVRADKVIE